MRRDPRQKMCARQAAEVPAIPLPTHWLPLRFLSCVFCLLLVCAAAPRFACAQTSTPTSSQSTQADQTTAPAPSDWSANPTTSTPQDLYDPGEPDKVTILPHSDTDGYWISAQANVVFQWHPS